MGENAGTHPTPLFVAVIQQSKPMHLFIHLPRPSCVIFNNPPTPEHFTIPSTPRICHTGRPATRIVKRFAENSFPIRRKTVEQPSRVTPECLPPPRRYRGYRLPWRPASRPRTEMASIIGGRRITTPGSTQVSTCTGKITKMPKKTERIAYVSKLSIFKGFRGGYWS